MHKPNYKYPKLASMSSYQKLLVTKVEELKLMGARIEIKEYNGRPPAWSVEAGGWTGKELKDNRMTLVVIKSPGKDGLVAASTYVTNEFYHGTVKVADREGTDVINGCVDSLLEHVDEYVRTKYKTNK